MTETQLIIGAAWFLVFVFSTTCHEASHALAALKLGDPTAYHGGQVSLNPIPHMRREPTGMILIPLLTLVLSGGQQLMGWASAPYDPYWADRHPKRAGLMALAGPASNFVLMLVALIALKIGLSQGYFRIPEEGEFGFAGVLTADDNTAKAIALILSIFFSLNLLLGILNMFPFPPLDGASIVPLFLSDRMTYKYLNLIRTPGVAFIGLFAAWGLCGKVFGPAFVILVVFLLYL